MTEIEKPIPFYGAKNRAMFAIERRCMDRDGHVLRFLNERLPAGLILDIGAGNGFSASRLRRRDRTIIPLEPAWGMIDRQQRLPWIQGMAQYLPFKGAALTGAYATWAYFLAGMPNRVAGLREVGRVLRPHAPLLIVDNAGGDEFSSLAPRPLAGAGAFYLQRGFSRTVLKTAFRFDTVAEAQLLLSFYFGEAIGRSVAKVEIGFNVAVYEGRSGLFDI